MRILGRVHENWRKHVRVNITVDNTYYNTYLKKGQSQKKSYYLFVLMSPEQNFSFLV